MSSTEDEETNLDAPGNAKQTDNRGIRFQCPADFVSFSYKSCSSTLHSNSKEIWLIRAPANFKPQSFSSIELPLCGLETVSVQTGDETEQSYNILGSPGSHPELHLLTPPATFAPRISGLISICESHSNHSTNPALHVVPAILPPSLPSGLKQRFQHFQTSAARTSQPQGEAGKKRKKKIKSEPQGVNAKQVTMETETVIKTEIKDEPLDTGFGQQLEVRKKKKKKSKRAE